jgi:anthraniloyl-CoA monooxygenase
LWNNAQTVALKRIADLSMPQARARRSTATGPQRPQGFEVGWESPDEPVFEGNWLLLRRRVLWSDQPDAAAKFKTHADMARLKDRLAQSAQRAVEAGFDWLELHFSPRLPVVELITPLTNQRKGRLRGAAWKPLLPA